MITLRLYKILKQIIYKINILNKNKIEIVKLWENPSPTATFEAQSVNAQCSDYKFIGVDFKGSHIVWVPYSEGRLGAYKQSGTVQVSGYSWLGFREFYLYPTQVTFTAHYHKYVNSTTGQTISNGNAIPLAIYGLK